MSIPVLHQPTSPSEGQKAHPAPAGERRRRLLGLLGGALLGVIVYLAMPADAVDTVVAVISPEAAEKVSEEGLRLVAAAAVVMGAWWMTEAIPLAATALLPLVLFPLAGVDSFKDTAAPYASGTIFLFMGGFMLALTMQRWNLHRRIALLTVLAVGTKPKMLVLGFMLATGFLSMWVSNTATAVMMLPIGTSILLLTGQADGKGKQSKLATALMLGIAYAASIGSLGTIIGTPPNTLLIAYLKETFDVTIGFGQWMIMGVPLALTFLLICWWLLTSVLFKPEIKEIPGGKALIREELSKLGPWSGGEVLVGVIFVAAALSWSLLPTLLPGRASRTKLSPWWWPWPCSSCRPRGSTGSGCWTGRQPRTCPGTSCCCSGAGWRCRHSSPSKGCLCGSVRSPRDCPCCRRCSSSSR